MQYLGIDVHSSKCVWCLLDEHGKQLATGKTQTTFPELRDLGTSLRLRGEVKVAQEVGGQVYLVHDAFTAAGVPILSFNPAHLRMIAASRKKSDRRDAYWIAKSLQTGMTPHPVYIPDGEIRELRRLLTRRRMVQRDRNRWQYRARAALRGHGHRIRSGGASLGKCVEGMLENPAGVDTELLESLGLCERMMTMLGEELQHIDAKLAGHARGNEVIERLQTIPGIGPVASCVLYATIGRVDRFPDARRLAAYAGLVPIVRQSGESDRHGKITKEGSSHLRSVLVQGAHVVASRSTSDELAPLRAVYERVRGTRGRRKIAVVALARHLLRIAYHVWRDGTVFEPTRVRCIAA